MKNFKTHSNNLKGGSWGQLAGPLFVMFNISSYGAHLLVKFCGVELLIRDKLACPTFAAQELRVATIISNLFWAPAKVTCAFSFPSTPLSFTCAFSWTTASSKVTCVHSASHRRHSPSLVPSAGRRQAQKSPVHSASHRRHSPSLVPSAGRRQAQKSPVHSASHRRHSPSLVPPAGQRQAQKSQFPLPANFFTETAAAAHSFLQNLWRQRCRRRAAMGHRKGSSSNILSLEIQSHLLKKYFDLQTHT